MKKRYIVAILALALAACSPLDQDIPSVPTAQVPTGKVNLSFKVAIPGESLSPGTKAMANVPAIDNIYVAVFGGSGFYNEWVKATIDSVDEANYNGTQTTIYNVSVALTMSESRLRLHFIANCPDRFKTKPPITGISAQDLEEIVMGKVRSHISDSHNDSYWQKVILPNGVKAKVVDTVDEQGNIVEDYYIDPVTGNYVASDATLQQFPEPIPLVRNFARIYLRNLAPDVTIYRYSLVFAPAEGPVAPVLSEAFPSDVNGNYIPDPDSYSGKIYYESFFRNYQNYPLYSDTATKLTDPPFNYAGYSPDYVTYGSFPADNKEDANYPTLEEMLVWDSNIDNSTGLQQPLFVYERGIPTSEHRATRVLIYAFKEGETNAKYYSLDIVDSQNNYVPIFRNQTYTVKLINIEAGAGESSIEAAAGSSSATVSGDPATQYVTEISDGSSSISTSYAEMLYVSPGTYDVYFRYIPTYAGEHAGEENNSLVTWEVGTKNESTGIFTPVPAANATNSVFKISGGQYQISIDKDASDNIVTYVRHGEGFTNDPAIVASTPDKWAKLSYTTVNDGSTVDSDGYFTVLRNAAIRITGSYEGHDIFRDVLVKISPRKQMIVKCLQKYVQSKINETEVVRVYIPTDLPRAVFPIQFKVEASMQSITPYGDILPVDTGKSIIPGKSGPSYFFIKNLTRTDYNGLSTERPEGQSNDWYYFDCTFKTTMAESASDVYVFNPYFDDDNNHDRFENYAQRLFSGLAFGSTPRVDTPVEFSFTMDTAHGTNTVWWDPDGNLEASLSTSNKVLPKGVLVILDGLQPEINEVDNHPYTSFSSGNSFDPNPNDDISYYIYNVGSSTTPATPSLADVTLRLVAGDNPGQCSVSLSTLNITENPELYAANSLSGTISGITITLNKTTTSIRALRTETLTATATPSAPGDVFTWSSSNTSIATVNGNGLINAVSPGTAVITASLGNASASCTVTVTAFTLTLNKTSASLPVGGTTTLTATVNPSYSGDVISWSSSDDSIATVSSSGVVTGHSAGNATITATLGTVSASCNVRVRSTKQESINTNDGTLSQGTNQTVSQGDVSITFSSIYGVNSGYVRPNRNGNTITFRANNKDIYEIVITFTGSGTYAHNYTISSGGGERAQAGTTWTWTGETKTLVISSTSRDARVSNITVKYYND